MNGKEKENRQVPTHEAFNEVMDQRFSKEIHAKLKEASVSIAGLGGLGSHIAVMLARTGVGHLHLVDFDKVELSNLNRQVYKIGHLHQLKAEALKQELLQINPYLHITTSAVRVDKNNAKELFEKDVIVCEAFDQPENKAMLVNTLLEQCPEVKIVAASGMAGYGSSNELKTKKIRKNLYLCGDGKTDVKEGVGLMAARVMICAGHQANMVIRLILGIEEA